MRCSGERPEQRKVARSGKRAQWKPQNLHAPRPPPLNLCPTTRLPECPLLAPNIATPAPPLLVVGSPRANLSTVSVAPGSSSAQILRARDGRQPAASSCLCPCERRSSIRPRRARSPSARPPRRSAKAAPSVEGGTARAARVLRARNVSIARGPVNECARKFSQRGPAVCGAAAPYFQMPSPRDSRRGLPPYHPRSFAFAISRCRPAACQPAEARFWCRPSSSSSSSRLLGL